MRMLQEQACLILQRVFYNGVHGRKKHSLETISKLFNNILKPHWNHRFGFDVSGPNTEDEKNQLFMKFKVTPDTNISLTNNPHVGSWRYGTNAKVPNIIPGDVVRIAA